MQRLVRTPCKPPGSTPLRRSRRLIEINTPSKSSDTSYQPTNIIVPAMPPEDEVHTATIAQDRDIVDPLATIKDQLSSLLGGLRGLQLDMEAEREARRELERRAFATPAAVQAEHAAATTSTKSEIGNPQVAAYGKASTSHQWEALSNSVLVQSPPTQPVLAQKLYALPKFDGRPDQWPLFAAAYQQSTEAFGYTPLQNLIRLQSSLEGAARETVRCLLIDPANVTEVMETLHFAYGRPQLLISDQLTQIRAMPVLQEHATNQFISMATRVRNIVSLLNTEESCHVLGDTTLLTELVSKLSPSKKEMWAEYASKIQPRATAVHFATWMTERARCLASLDLKQPDSATSTQRTSTPSTKSPKAVKQERHVLHSVQQSVQETMKATPKSGACGLCDGLHRVTSCPRYTQQSVAERWKTARRLRLCFGCLRNSHSFRDCRSKRQCQFDNCTYWHHDSLHDISSVRRTTNPGTSSAVQVTSQPNETTTISQRGGEIYNCRETPGNSIIFRIVPVTLHGRKGRVDTYALIDEGSSFTAIDAELAEKLGLQGPVSPLNLQFIGNNGAVENSQEVEFDISGHEQPERRFLIRHARTVRNLNLPIQSLSVTAIDPSHVFLRGLPVLDYQNAKPKLLIGLDHCQLGVGIMTRISDDGGLVAAKTPLGWVVYGSQSAHNKVAACYHCQHTTELSDLDRLIKEYYTTESFGVKPSGIELESNDDARARSIMVATTQRVGERFQTGLLWRTDKPVLPYSRNMAEQRLESLLRRLRRESECSRLYEEQIHSYVRKGYARKLNPEEASQRDDKTWYLPHFGVRSASKPEKLRLVFDAAAGVRGISLNSSLLKGPDLNQPLVNILHRFRMGCVGVSADIAEMFHQVKIQPDDRRSQRFLWKNCNQIGPPDEYEMSVMTFGACCSPVSAQYVKNVNAVEHELEFPEAARAIHEDHYVDDYVASFSTTEQAIRVTRDVVEVHRRGGFHLRGFVSNCPAVIKELSGTNTSEIVDMQLSGSSGQKILGLRWDTQNDQFVFVLRFDKVPDDVVSGERLPTKREILSATMSIFDPFGFLADFTIQSKLIIQDLWRSGVTWDEYIPDKIASRWLAWFREVDRIRHFNIPRCYSPIVFSGGEVQLHIFADASESAFAAVAYWRVEHAGQYTLSFIMGKSRCAPTKPLTVPRLELQAAVLATRLYQDIIGCHDIRNVRLVMWTDSQTVLHWIMSTERRFKTFVAHRVAEILEGTGATAWRWVPTHQNVADDATRGCDQPQFDPDSRWIRGPGFLFSEESEWPTIPNNDQTELINKQTEDECLRFVGAIHQESIIDFGRFSSFKRLRRTAALVLRFINNIRTRKNDRQIGVLSVAELHAGTKLLCRIAQMESYPNEYDTLQSGAKLERTSTVRKLRPYMDDDKLLRLYGRTDLAEAKFLPFDAKRPILLGRHHQLSELIVRFHHERLGHQLEDATICAVRRMFWIPHLRVLARKVKSSCQHCKNRLTQPQRQIMGQLPVDRLTPYEFPFKSTGLDYFGPVQVTVARRREKRWIALFTCLTTRAVHLEVASDLSTDACLMAVRNFANIRGTPARIRSDCGTNFIGADGVLRRTADFFDMAALKRELGTEGIEWLFNYPANPEAGGIWERLVQSTKRVLAETLREVAPQVETLRSLVIEAANILNSRPLTHIPVSPDELEPLTPNHFILGRANSTTTQVPLETKQLCNRRQWVVCQQLTRMFWRRWVREYLPVLTRRTKEYADATPIREGDLVLICDGNQSRGEWMRGRVTELIEGTDGVCRLARVATSSGSVKRPMSKLAKLDVVSETESHGVRDVGERDIDPAVEV